MNDNPIFTFEKKSTTGINWFSPSLGVFLMSTNVGIIAVDSTEKKGLKEIYLIDSGPNPKGADKIFNALKEEFSDFTIKAVINTHSHADHCGANRRLSELSGCEIWATYHEKPGIEHPLSQTSIAYGGYPLPEYKTPYHLAEPSKVARVIESNSVFNFSPDISAECILLPGHYFEMIGILCTTKTVDGTKKVFFTADGIFSKDVLSQYWIPYTYDIGKFKEGLSIINETKADFFVTSHGEIYTEISALFEFNMMCVVQNEITILSFLKDGPKTHEEILKHITDINDIQMRLSQFMLVGSTLRSYLTYLYETKKITWTFKDNRMFWKLRESE